jgi:VCBS repeat-containing protein
MRIWPRYGQRWRALVFTVLLAAVLPACTGVGGGGGDEGGIGNTPPQITSLNFTAVRNTQFAGQLTAVDPDLEALTFEGVTQTTSGPIAVQGNGSFTYTPSPNFLGRDQFIARVTDARGASTSATITINVVPPVNQAPTLTSTIFTTRQATPLSAQLTASDPENDLPITFALVTPSANGTVTVAANGAFTYSPVATFTGADSFTVRVTDSRGASRVGTVTITVTQAPNQPPTITSLTFTVISGRPFNGQLTAVDPENQTFTFQLVSQPANGAVTVQPSGAFVYTPNVGFTGPTDTWVARVTDALGAFSDATITMNVVANRAPVAVDDVYDNDPATTTIPNYTIVSPTEISLNVTANDTDADNDPLVAQLEASVPVFGGTSAVADAGNIRVTLPAGFRGLVRLQYRARDPSNATSNLATAIAFVDTAAFNVSFIGNEFAGGTNELALADLLQPARRVNGVLAAGNVTSYVTSANGRTFAYVVDRLNAFFATSAALGTGNALYTATAGPGTQHQRTTISADGTRVCSTYYDGSVNTSLGAIGAPRSFVVEVANPTAGVAVPLTNRPVCFDFRANGTDILFLGQEADPSFRDGLYQAAASAPTVLSLLTRAGIYGTFVLQPDKVFLTPDTSRALLVLSQAGSRGVYDLSLAASGSETLISQQFGLIGALAASPARDRVAFSRPQAALGDPFALIGYDRAAAQTPVTLYTDPAVNADFPAFSPDGSRVAYVTVPASGALGLCDTAFGGPFGCNALLPGFAVDATSLITYDSTASNLIVAARQAAGDFKLYQVPRAAGGSTELTPNNLSLQPAQNFFVNADSTVIAVALRESTGGPIRVFLINRAVPGQALQVSGPSTQVERGSVRLVPR